MKVRKEYIVIAVLIVALSLYLLMRSRDRTHYELPVLPTVSKDAIDRIVVTRPAGEITLEKRNGAWTIIPEGYPADEKKVEAMEDALTGLDIGAMVSESGSYGRYDLDEDGKIVAEAFGGGESLAKVDIGKTASTYRHTYIRLPGDDRIYQASGNLRRTFDLEKDRIRDRNVLDAERSSVTGLTVAGVDGRVSLTKISKPSAPPAAGQQEQQEMTEWITPDSVQADGKIVDGILRQLTSLDADGFPADSIATGDYQFFAALGGTGDTLYVYDYLEGDKKYVASSTQYAFPFLLSEWKAKQIMKTPDEIMGKKDDTQGE